MGYSATEVAHHYRQCNRIVPQKALSSKKRSSSSVKSTQKWSRLICPDFEWARSVLSLQEGLTWTLVFKNVTPHFIESLKAFIYLFSRGIPGKKCGNIIFRAEELSNCRVSTKYPHAHTLSLTLLSFIKLNAWGIVFKYQRWRFFFSFLLRLGTERQKKEWISRFTKLIHHGSLCSRSRVNEWISWKLSSTCDILSRGTFP